MPERTLTDGSPVTSDHRELLPNGQQKGYVVLSEEERAKGFARPVRKSYIHVIKPGVSGCGTVTTMGQSIAESYARQPNFYNATFCCHCRAHYPVEQFVWEGTNEPVGS